MFGVCEMCGSETTLAILEDAEICGGCAVGTLDTLVKRVSVKMGGVIVAQVWRTH